jgi:hypothetical protein
VRLSCPNPKLVIPFSPCPFIPFCRYVAPCEAGYIAPSRTLLAALRVLVVDPLEWGLE